MQVDFIRRKSQIADRQVGFGVGFVNQCLEPPVMLLAIGEAAADDGEMIAFFEFTERLGGNNGAYQGEKHRGEEGTAE